MRYKLTSTSFLLVVCMLFACTALILSQVLAENLESFTAAQLQTYRTHFEPNNDDICEDDKRPGIRPSSGGKTLRCPHNDCDREEPFQHRKHLQRHFEQRKRCTSIFL